MNDSNAAPNIKYGADETPILNLNDHCLQKIFRFLDAENLCSIANVNERFKRNAETVFPLEFKSFEIHIDWGSAEWMLNYDRLENFVGNFWGIHRGIKG